MSTVLLHGGGYDSTAVFLWMRSLNIPFECLSIDYGHIAYELELDAAKQQCERYGIKLVTAQSTAIKDLNDRTGLMFSGDLTSNAIVEGRNLLLIMKAVELGYQTIYVGLDKPQSGQAWPDASKEFVQTINLMLSFSFLNKTVQVIAPFITMNKQHVYQMAYEADPDFFELGMTCWAPVNGAECGKCKHCLSAETFINKIKG